MNWNSAARLKYAAVVAVQHAHGHGAKQRSEDKSKETEHQDPSEKTDEHDESMRLGLSCDESRPDDVVNTANYEVAQDQHQNPSHDLALDEQVNGGADPDQGGRDQRQESQDACNDCPENSRRYPKDPEDNPGQGTLGQGRHHVALKTRSN